ncbi:MAG: hypothetical protein WC878_05720 [Candidatus Paceibacterota bacterium]|jgi:hypothetical protein
MAIARLTATSWVKPNLRAKDWHLVRARDLQKSLGLDLHSAKDSVIAKRKDSNSVIVKLKD